MPTAIRFVRMLGLAAGLLATVARPVQAIIVEASVSPGTVVPVGTVITLTMTITSESLYPWGLGNLEAYPLMQSEGCPLAGPALDGWYSVYTDNPALVTTGIPSSASLNFYRSESSTQWVEWKFTATRTGTVSFSMVAGDKMTGAMEGCSDPAPYYPFYGTTCQFCCLPWGTDGCGFTTVTITSTLSGRVDARYAGPDYARPAGTVFVGDPIEVVMSVTNEGAAPITINAAIASTVGTYTTALVTPTAAPAFPVTLGGGASNLLTWTFDVPQGSSPGTAVFWVDAERTLAFSAQLAVIAAPLTLSVTVWIDPDGAGPAPVAPARAGYYMADDEVWVVATLQNPSPWSVTVDPAILPADQDGNHVPDFASAGARIPATAQNLPSLGSRAFTWKYKVDRTDYYQFCHGFPPADMNWIVSARGVSAQSYLPMLGTAFVITPEIPPVVEIGTAFSGTLWVANMTGRAIVLDACATVYLEASAPVRATIVGLPPAGSWTFAAGEARPFGFTCTADSVGSQYWGGGIAFAGMGPPWGACLPISTAVSTEIVAPSPLVPTLLSSTNLVNARGSYGLTLSVFNSSTCQATLASMDQPYGLDERPIPYAVLSPWASTGCPTLPCMIAASATVTFTWSVTTYGCGDEDWSGTMTGDWDPVCLTPTAFSRPYHSNRIRIRQQASLFDPGSVAWILPSLTAVESRNFEVVCRVAPGGENDIDNFSLAIAPHFSSTSTAISLVSAPPIPAVLAGCGSCVTNVCWDKVQSFTWVFRADTKGGGQGRVWFTFTASGRDPYDATPVQSVTNTGAVRILRPSTITVSALHDSGGTNKCEGAAEMIVAVDGDTPVLLTSLGITPSSLVADVLAAPYVCCSVTIFSGTGDFIWTYTPVGVGCVSFTVSAVGVETGLGQVVYGAAKTDDTRCFTAPVLGGSLRSFPVAPAAGSPTPVEVRLTVTNGGQIRADDVWISAWSLTGTASCGGNPARLPVLASTVFADTSAGLYGCDDQAQFIWRFATAPGGEGDVVFAVTVTGKRADTLGAISFSDSFCITLWPSMYVSIVSVPENVIQGHDFEVGIRLDNQSAATVKVTPVFPVLTSGTGDLLELSPAPGMVTIGPFATTTVTARMTVRASAVVGQDRLAVSAAQFVARDAATKGVVPVPVNAGPSVVVNVLPNKPVFEIGENPWHPLHGPLPIRFVAPDGGRITIKAYSLAGELVRTLLDERNPALQGTVLWDGRNADGQPVAAGIYLLRFEGLGLKVTRKLAVIK